MIARLKFFAVALLFPLSVFSQQLKMPAPSPSQTLKQSFGLGEITVDYSRPSVKGRTIFGEVVSYDKIWRTGANASTKITFSDDVTLEGKPVKAGTYALYTIPGTSSWEVMLYSDLSLGGSVHNYKQENEVVRVKVQAQTLSQPVETFTIQIANISNDAAILELAWDKVRVPVSLKTDIDARIMKNIETALAADSRPYFQAASYYYENNKDLNKAAEWITKAVEQNPKAFWIMLMKARIELKQNNKAAAIASAEKTKALAKEAQNDDYVRMADAIISEAKKK